MGCYWKYLQNTMYGVRLYNKDYFRGYTFYMCTHYHEYVFRVSNSISGHSKLETCFSSLLFEKSNEAYVFCLKTILGQFLLRKEKSKKKKKNIFVDVGCARKNEFLIWNGLILVYFYFRNTGKVFV